MTTKLILDKEGIIVLLKKCYEGSDDVKLHIRKEIEGYGLAEHEVSKVSAEIIFYSNNHNLI